MPVDEFIEEVTDGTPSVEGDLYVIQRNVAGVWTDYFIRAENIAGSAVFMADITIDPVVTVPSVNVLLPQVAGKAYVLIDPPVLTVTGNSPTSGVGDIVIGDAGVSAQWSIQFNDTETDATYQMLGPGIAFTIGTADIALQTSVFSGASLRVRFSYTLADI